MFLGRSLIPSCLCLQDEGDGAVETGKGTPVLAPYTDKERLPAAEKKQGGRRL